jgi:hypothetical protein
MSVLFEKTFPVAAVCDRRSEPTPALIERRYSASRSVVAAICCKNQTYECKPFQKISDLKVT